ncbi:hypothetical protein A8C56_07395 [Niabella ginsenosidivorans]|uniref:UspA domain-containing protein n=1 Tax=Niabella ginsenosidivorans TaxID=1176587 RepID=A0A1A9HZJ1_9BACT|nr:universal stress protein [Niabella ginsenosidivorans]ANH80827.1 hypothetical protein A8C56_07395 [Niabella ginsenosidivorans]
MKTIIAATNFSEVSNHAVDFAADVAKAVKARLIIFNVVNIVPAMSDAQLPLDACGATIEETDKLLSELLLKTKKRVNNEIEIEAVYKVGSVIRELDALCDREAPFAVFIASQFVTVLERLVLGTYSVTIAKYSSFPVIVIPPLATMNGFKKVGLAVDLTGSDSLQWPFLRSWLKPFHPQTDIVYVSSGSAGSAKEVPMTVEIQEQLDNFNLKYHFLANDNIVDGIKEYIIKNAPDLLIMFVQKHGIFHKSITKAFIKEPPVPVMFFSSKLKGAFR